MLSVLNLSTTASLQLTLLERSPGAIVLMTFGFQAATRTFHMVLSPATWCSLRHDSPFERAREMFSDHAVDVYRVRDDGTLRQSHGLLQAP